MASAGVVALRPDWMDVMRETCAEELSSADDAAALSGRAAMALVSVRLLALSS